MATIMKNNILTVVVTYNRIEMLKQCTSSIKNQTLQSFDILIVDNASTDGTGDYMSSINDP